MGRRVCSMPALLLALILCLCGCEKSPQEQYGESYETVRLLHQAYTEITRGEMDFHMEATFRDPETNETGVLYFLRGNGHYDKKAQTAWQTFDATHLGASYRSEEYFADEQKVHLENGEVFHIPTKAEEFFQAFPYCSIPLPPLSSLQSMEQHSVSGGNRYTMVFSAGQNQLVKDIWKLDLYKLTGIANPDYEKESYGDMTFVIVEKGGSIQSIFVELSVAIYKRAAYTPGYTPKGDDNRLELKITAKVEVKNQGEAVEIPVYEETSDTVSEE